MDNSNKTYGTGLSQINDRSREQVTFAAFWKREIPQPRCISPLQKTQTKEPLAGVRLVVFAPAY